MKKYLVFYGQTYYASGGWDDFREDCDSLEDAEVSVSNVFEDSCDWFQIVDSETGKVLKGKGAAHSGLFGLANKETNDTAEEG